MAVVGRYYYSLCETRLGHGLIRRTLPLVRVLGGLRGFKMPLDSLDLPHAAVRELMRLWRRMHWSSGDGMMPPNDLKATYTLAFRCPVEGDFVELGAWKGLTTCYLATACRARGGGRVFAVDTFAGTCEHSGFYIDAMRSGGTTYPVFRQTIERAAVEDLVTVYAGYTVEMAARHRGGKVALLLIDADHSYEGVKADFEAWFPLVVPGGTVIFHDYKMPGVRRFVDEEIRGRRDLQPCAGDWPINFFPISKTGAQ